MVKLSQDGHVPQPFSHNIQTELTAMNNPIELKRKAIFFFLFKFIYKTTQFSEESVFQLKLKVKVKFEKGIDRHHRLHPPAVRHHLPAVPHHLQGFRR